LIQIDDVDEEYAVEMIELGAHKITEESVDVDSKVALDEDQESDVTPAS
jgi:hypothetical protein